MKKFLFCMAIFGIFALSGCHDNEPEITGEDEIEYPVPEVDRVNDVIKTTMDARTCVMSTSLDDMGALFVKRLQNTVPELDDDTELLVLDDEACYKYVKDSEEYNKISDYYFRGGIIYLHKPAMGAALLMAKLQYGMSPEISEDKVTPLAEAYICHISGAEFWGELALEKDTYESIYYDEDGNEYTEKQEGHEKPSEYYSGLQAESAAKFVNEVINNLVRSNATAVRSRAGSETVEPAQIPVTWSPYFAGSTTYKLNKNRVIDFSMTGDYKMYIRAAYSFDMDKDYYELKFSQTIPMSQAFRGHFNIKHGGAYKDKYGGYTFGGHSVEVELCNYKSGVSIYSLDGVLPTNEPLNGSEASVKGWTANGNLSLGKGLVIGGGGGYTSTTNITVPYKDIPVTYQQKRKDLLRWDYSVHKPMSYYKHNGRNGGYNKGPEICEKDMTLEQGWNWIVSDTKRQSNTPLQVKIKTTTTLRSGACTAGAGKNKSWNNLYTISKDYSVNLPVPERFRNQYSIVASPLNDESVRLRQLFIQNCDKFKFLVEHPDRCAVTDLVLKRKMRDEWQAVFDQIAARAPISNVKEEVTFYLEDSSGNRLQVGGGNYYGIRIKTDGKVGVVP